jgi:hypothetical protein
VPAVPDIGLITCQKLPEPDPDQDLLAEALDHAGITAELIAWDDPGRRPADYKMCVFRSCWNYFDNIDAFVRWMGYAERAAPLLNSAEVVRWNIHKRYLNALRAEGIPTVPTVFGWCSESMNLGQIADEQGWSDVVVKPAISAGSVRTRRFEPGQLDEGQRFLNQLLVESDVMIQPYLPSVESAHGERSVIGIDGRWTHTIRKARRFEGDAESVSEALPVTDDEASIADRCLEVIGYDLFYARVDLMADNEGQLRVSEVELIEPSLFLAQSSEALERYVSGLARIVN